MPLSRGKTTKVTVKSFCYFCLPAEDFELVFGETESLINRVTYVISNTWFEKIVICAWIFTPGIADDQSMTVISMITENDGSGKRVLTVQISGLGGFHITFGDQRYATRIVFLNQFFVSDLSL